MKQVFSKSINTKIQAAILLNVIFAIMLGEYVVDWLLDVHGWGRIALNLGINITIALLYGYFVSKAITNPLLTVVHKLEELANSKGDLTEKLEYNTEDEIGSLCNSFNHIIETLNHIITSVILSTEDIQYTSKGFMRMEELMREDIETLTDITVSIAAQLEKINAGVNEMNINAENAKETSEQAENIAVEGGTVIQETISGMHIVSTSVTSTGNAMQKIKDESDKIDSILHEIRGLSEQTNLLALNAAIEAARAGESGRGFAVVADEVRSLASNTNQSTNDISEVILGIQNSMGDALVTMQDGITKVNSAVELVDNAGVKLTNIVESSQKVMKLVVNISEGVHQQISAHDTITKGINQVVDVTNHSHQSVQQIIQFSQSLADQVTKLGELVGEFKVAK